MKIRSDFVANSSSFSSVVIRIQSKELAQLLAKYRQLFDSIIRISPDGIFVDLDENAEEWNPVPQSLEQLLDALLDGLKWNIYQKLRQGPLARQLKQEIKENKQELTDSVQMAVWDFQDIDEPIGRKRFFYDRKKGGKGEYREEPYSEDGCDDAFKEEYDNEFGEGE